MQDEMLKPKKTNKSKKYTGMIIRVILALGLGYLAYVLYIKTYLDGMLKY